MIRITKSVSALVLWAGCLWQFDALGQVERGPDVRSTEEYSGKLYDAKHEPWEMPDSIVAAMDIRKSDTVVEISDRGVGYFGRRFARLAERVYSVAQDEESKDRALDDGPVNFVPTITLPGRQTVDKILLHNMLQQIENRPEYFESLGDVLKGHGRIYVIDFYKRLPPGLPPSSQITSDVVITDMKKAGFRLVATPDFLPFQYFLVFER